jgi:hypothetical protein
MPKFSENNHLQPPLETAIPGENKNKKNKKRAEKKKTEENMNRTRERACNCFWYRQQRRCK